MIFLCLAPTILARGQYYFDKWDTDSGLPQNTVGAVTQTRDGYLWLATLDGLVRFDGVKFKIFTVGNSAGLNNNRFRLLREAPDGALWIGSEEFGVARYLNGKFRTYTTADGLPTDSPLALAIDADGAPLVLTANGLVRFDGESFRRVPLDTAPTVRSCEARGGGMWILDVNGLRKISDGAVTETGTDFKLKPEDFAAACYEAPDGTLWLGRLSGRLFSFKNGQLTSYGPESGLPAGAVINFINQDRAGNLWIGTDDGLLKLAGGRFERYSPASGLSDKFVLSFYEDRENTLWFGTTLGGLNRLSRRAISVLTTADGLTGNSVYPIYEARDGAIWLGANGVTRIAGGRITKFPLKEGGMFGDVTAIAEDGDGTLWLGAAGAVGTLSDGKFTNLKKSFILPEGSYTVWAICRDRTGAVWFGTSHGLVRKKGDVYEIFKTADGLPGDDVKVVHEDRNGALWFGTYGGLAVLNPEFNRSADQPKSLFKTELKTFTAADGLSSSRIRSIYEDEAGVFWIGTYDGGLNRFADGRFTVYSTKNGLFSDGVFQILPDDEGYFWMSSNQGIYRVARAELEDLAAGRIQAVSSEAFGKRDGLLNTECNGGRQPAGVRARDGRLWFPTQEGAAVVDPRTVGRNPLPPPVILEGVTIDRKNIDLTEPIEIRPDQINLEIAYTGLSFVKPEQMRFRYRLEGLNDDWTEAGTRRTAYFSYLPPGEYTFRVTAANNSGVWNTEGASLRLKVYPPFWKTWWFAALAAMTAGLLIYLILRRRFAKIERERAAQVEFTQNLIAAQERERKRIAGEIHDGLGQNLLVIKNWALLALQKKQLPDAVLLEEISETASQTIEEARRIAYNLRPYQIDEIGLTRAVEGMIRRLKASGEIDIEMQIDNIDDCFPPDGEINLFRIVQECLNNIVRHSGAREAWVTIRREPQKVLVKIEDRGKGFAPESIGGKRGLGLTGIEERARMLGGRSLIQSVAGKGTIVQIQIDL
ncbi:MAG: hypothetical protein JSS81_22065 [Acidobacteria bacterium]|nr:hypothetical protein [Acidobacteriota bacterium]